MRLAFTVDLVDEAIDAPAFVSDLAVGPDGSLYVADYDRCRVIRVGADGRTVGAFGGCGEADGRFMVPTTMAIDSRGIVAVADELLGRIQRFDAQGRWLDGIDARQVLCHLPEGQCPARPFDGLIGIVFDDQDRLHVYDWLHDAMSSSRVRMLTWARFDQAGGFEVVQHDSWQPDRFVSGSLALGGDGSLLAVNGSGHAVVRLAPGPTDTEDWISVYGREPITDLAVGPDGAVWVVAERQLLRLDRRGGITGQWFVPEGSLSTSVAVGPDGRVYVAVSQREAAMRAALGERIAPRPVLWLLDLDAPKPKLEPFWGRPPSGRGALAATIVQEIAAGSGRVHLLGSTHDAWWDEGVDDGWLPVPPQVLSLDDAGGFVAKWGGSGSEDGRFSVGMRSYPYGQQVRGGPLDIAADARGRVYVSDTYADRVQRFDRDGRFDGIAARFAEGQDGQPRRASVADDGTVAVLDGRYRVHRFDGLGQPFGAVLEPPDGEAYTLERTPLALSRDGSAIDMVWHTADGIELVRRDFEGREVERRIVPQHGAGRGMIEGLGLDAAGGPIVLNSNGVLLAGARQGGWSSAMWPELLRWQRWPWLKMATDEAGDVWISHYGRLQQRSQILYGENLPQRHLYRYVRAWPETWHAELFPDRHLGGPALVITNTAELALPDPVAGSAGSARFERVFGPEDLIAIEGEESGGTYRLWLRVAGGARLWVGERLIVDDWQAEEVDRELTAFLPSTWGQRIVLEVRAAPVAGAVSVELEPLAAARRIYLPIAHGHGRMADMPPPPPTPTPSPGYPGP